MTDDSFPGPGDSFPEPGDDWSSPGIGHNRGPRLADLRPHKGPITEEDVEWAYNWLARNSDEKDYLAAQVRYLEAEVDSYVANYCEELCDPKLAVQRRLWQAKASARYRELQRELFQIRYYSNRYNSNYEVAKITLDLYRTFEATRRAKEYDRR